MEKDIKFIGYNCTKSDFDCVDGEIQYSNNIGEKPGAGFCGTLSAMSVVSIPVHLKGIAIHQTISYGEHLILAESNGKLYWCDYLKESTSFDRLQEIGTTADIRCVASYGDTLILGTAEGIIYLIWTSESYRIFHPDMEMPTIDFGLQKAGNLITNETIVTDASNYQHIGAAGSGASTVHPTADEGRTSIINIGEAIGNSYDNALKAKVHQNGYFYQPFFIMYSVRLADGSHIMHSSPILMLPTTLPPIIAITARTGSDDKTYIDIDLTQNNYFELRYRIKRAIPQQLADIATAIDIYISQPIMTYEADKIGSGYMAKYTDMINATDSGGNNRGRHYPSRGEDESLIFLGHYSLGNDNYIDHTTASSNHSVWCISPNPHFQDDLISEHPMYLISSIPIDNTVEMNEFKPLDILTSHYSKITEHERLDTNGIALQRQYQDIIPSAMAVYGNQLVSAANQHKVSTPRPLSTMTAYSGDGSSTAIATEITVYTRLNGRIHKSARTFDEFRKPLSADFPRFIMHYDDNAFLMTLKQGESIYTLPLTSDKTRKCAYWYGGLMSSLIHEAAQIPKATDESIAQEHCTIYISHNDGLQAVKSTLKPGCDSIIAFASALQAPVNGHFGDYPLYAFAKAGIFMLQYDDETGTFTTARLISNDRCTSPAAVTSRENQVIYATSDSIKALSGSKTTIISQNISQRLCDLRILPHIDELLNLSGTSLHEDIIEHGLSDCLVFYDRDSKSLIASLRYSAHSVIKHDESESWSFADLNILKKLYNRLGDTAIDSNNDIVIFESKAAQRHGLLVTRPIKLNTPITRKRISSVEVLGHFNRGHIKTALYGADRQEEWHLLSTSQSEVVDEYSSRSFRFIRIVVIAKLDAGEYIYGIKVKHDTDNC